MEPQVVQLPAIELVERMRLSRIDEGREISERVVIQRFAAEAVRTLDQLSPIDGLRAVILFPFGWLSGAGSRAVSSECLSLDRYKSFSTAESPRPRLVARACISQDGNKKMPYRDSAFHLRDQAVRLPPQPAGWELVPLPIAAVIAYARLIGDPMEVRNTSVLQDRLDRIALALSAVATVHVRGPGETPGVRRHDLAAAIDLLRRSGIAFSE